MRLHHMAAAMAAALMVSGCANAAPEEVNEKARFCAVLLSEGAAYVGAHVAQREEQLKVMRFASEEAMDAYNEVTDTFAVLRIDLIGMLGELAREYGLPEDAGVYTFEDTTDDGAWNRIDFAKECVISLDE